jgi:hypothetical protein
MPDGYGPDRPVGPGEASDQDGTARFGGFADDAALLRGAFTEQMADHG